jgi:hypothetical protein
MEINLTEEQQQFVDSYNKILNRLEVIQSKINELEIEAAETIEELNNLRARERESSPEGQD